MQLSQMTETANDVVIDNSGILNTADSDNSGLEATIVVIVVALIAAAIAGFFIWKKKQSGAINN
jgi:hypothetical protein